MWVKINPIRIKLKTVLGFILVLITLASVTPVLADYLGPDRTKTQTVTTCKVNLNECQFVPAKNEWRYKVVNDWVCSNESKPWKAYPNNPSGDCTPAAAGDKYWEKDESSKQVIKTYPPATISGTLLDCTLSNGWCTTPPQLSLSGTEPVVGHNIIAIEGSLNGQNFACPDSNCSVPLLEGDNAFTYWALSSFGDSSTMGSLTAKVDTQQPVITGTFTGTSGSNGWFRSPVSFSGSASDATSGLAGFTCTLDGELFGSCNSISVDSEGAHTLVLTAFDNAGNINSLSQSMSIDTQAPALTASIQGTLGSNNWFNDAELSASATDPTPGSGLSGLEYSVDNAGWVAFPSSGVLDLPEGNHSIDIRAMDNAGHSTSSSKSFSLDSSAPFITLDPMGTLGLNNWYVTSLDLTASASDGISGVDVFDYTLNGNSWTSYTTPLNLNDGSYSVTFWAQDKAGLVTQVNGNYHVDTHPPQIAGSLSGTPGINGWYVSDVILSASAADPMPGSGVDIFTYNIDAAGEIPYVSAITIPDGFHTVRLHVQDKAGLTYFVDQTIKVDTIQPALNIQTIPPAWIKGNIILNGTASDSGSGISRVEISTNGGQTWQATTGTTSWSYEWDTSNSSNGSHHVMIRAVDQAGLITEQNLPTGVDNRNPNIKLPNSWNQWDTVTLDIWDDESGLAEARVEISDPDGRWPKRVIQLNIDQFPLRFKWDRRFGDNTVAPYGNYDVEVTALDKLGNVVHDTASVKVLIEILPPGPTATSQPYSRIVSTPTATHTVTPVASSTATATSVISAFGETPPTAQSTPTTVVQLEPRATPTQSSVLDWLESIFSPNADSIDDTIELESVTSQSTDSSSPAAATNLLWGVVAAAVVGVVTEQAQEKRHEKAQRTLLERELEAREEERREQRREQKMEKLEAQWAQEKAWELARLQQEQFVTDSREARMEEKMAHLEATSDAQWMASQIVIQQRAEAERRKEELQEGLNAYYAAMRLGEKQAEKKESNWWEKTKSFVQEKILEPLDEYVYEPIVEPVIGATSELLSTGSSWISNTVYQPYIAPVVEVVKQTVQETTKWVNENVYQPYIQPAVEKTVEFITEEASWINENIIQPYIEPALTAINENIVQPYIVPIVNNVVEQISDGVSWVNENIYEPYIEPAATYLNEHIYEPVFSPVVDDVSSWWQSIWDKYGEWVHGALDTAGFIPGLGEVADALNGLVYLGEGRYLEAGISAMAMIPILGDLGKAGKWGIQLGAEIVEEVVEETAEKVVKEVAEELTEELAEKVAKESLQEVVEETAEEATEELFETAAKETLEEAAEKTLKESGEELASKVVVETIETSAEKALKKEVTESAVKETADELATQIAKDTAETATVVATQNVTETITETVVEKTIKQVDEAFISTITEKYGADQVSKFLPMCERYGIDPYDILTRPPSEGQSLVGWVLGISDPTNPVNFALAKLDLPQSEIDRIMEKSTIRPDSQVVVLGYGGGCAIPYYELSNKIEGCNISLSATDWAPFDQARANFWTDINAPFIEQAIDERKVFLFNIDYDVITNPRNVSRYSLPELRLIEMAGNNYTQVPVGEFVAFFPTELWESGADWPEELLKLGDLK